VNAARNSANAPRLPGFGLVTHAVLRPHRNPVHTGSTRIEVRWTRVDRRMATKAFHQAREWDRRTHVAGRHGGRLGHVALQVLHCLIFDFLSFKTGRLDPSYEAIAAKANLARSTVAEALKRLRTSGILHWLRRCEETYEDGRYVLRQVSNAYAVLPPSLWRHAGILAPEAPTPAPGTWGDHPPLPDVASQAAEVIRAGAGDAPLLRLLDLEPADSLDKALLNLGRGLAKRAES